MDAAFTQLGFEFRAQDPEKQPLAWILPPGVFSETRDYTEWLFIRPEIFMARSVCVADERFSGGNAQAKSHQ